MHFIERIYIIASIISLLALIIIMGKFVTKRLRIKGFSFFKKADILLMKIHKSASIVLVIFAILHGMLTFFRFKEFGANPYIMGTASLLSCIAAIGSFNFKKRYKEPNHWLIHHRLFAIIAIITFIVHIALSR